MGIAMAYMHSSMVHNSSGWDFVRFQRPGDDSFVSDNMLSLHSFRKWAMVQVEITWFRRHPRVSSVSDYIVLFHSFKMYECGVVGPQLSAPLTVDKRLLTLHFISISNTFNVKNQFSWIL